MPDQVADYLRTLNLSDRARAAAWDAANAATDAEAQQRLSSLPGLSDDVRANLWDLRHGGTLTGQVKDFTTARPEDFEDKLEGTATQRFFRNAGEMLNPISMARGAYQIVRHPIDTAGAVLASQHEQFNKVQNDLDAGRYSEAAGHTGAGLLPLLGPIAAQSGEQIGSGDVAGGLGKGVGLVMPVAAAAPVARAIGRTIGKTATPLVRSAIKPTVTAARMQAGASISGLNAQAERLAAFIAENGITNRTKAQAIVEAAERELSALTRNARVATDAPQRATRYLGALERSASRQGLPADDVAVIRAKAAELLKGPLAEDVPVMGPPSMGNQMAGNTALTPTTTRALRTDVMPDEALELARGGGRWGNRKSWGEQKGAAREASKAVERAERDAVKAAVPETRPILQRQGQAIQAREALDRMEFRQANREPVSPFDVTTAAVEVGTGRAPILSVARHILRENKLRMGVWAKRLERAIENNDEATAALILDRFGFERGANRSTNPSGSQTPALQGLPEPLTVTR